MYDSIIIVGPTATGKTSLAINIAKSLNSEIINADSMYIYKSLNIGTAKPTKDEMQGVKHHLIDIVSPENSFNVAEFKELAKERIEYFKANHLFPIIVGGTGFYIDSFITNYSYGASKKDESLREELLKECEEKGKEYLYHKLQILDPDTASKLEINDVKRVVRAIEICLLSGQKKSEIQNIEKPLLSNPLIIGLNLDRDLLYSRINSRVDKMIDNGLVEEVKKLYALGLTPENNQSLKGIGYKEIIEYLRGICTLEYSIDKIKQHTRNYAKRQITWFKRNKNIHWFDSNNQSISDITKYVLELKNNPND